MKALLDYLGRLTVTQGEGAGEAFRVLPWQSRFIKGAFAVSGDAALSVGRGNGKSALVAGIACATLDPEGPLRQRRAETVIVASSFEQGRIDFEHVHAFMETRGFDLSDRKRWRVWDTAQQARIECRETGARVRCLGSDPKRAHGLAPLLVLADEPAQWGAQGEAMRAALRTSAGKVRGSRLIALGTRPKGELHWFSKMLAGGAAYSQCHAARPDDPPFHQATWAKANPSMRYFPELLATLRREAADAKADPALLATFEALRLNLGVSDVLESVLLDAATWERIEGEAERRGPYVLGVDLGGSAAMTGAAAFWPATGALDVRAAFPQEPALEERGLRDGVGGAYRDMARRGELVQAGRHTVDLAAFLALVVGEWGAPAAVVADRWREDLLREALDKAALPVVPLVLRGQGFKDGASDVDAFRKACLDGDVMPVRSLLMRSAMSEARTVADPAGNEKLSKAAQGGRRQRARDDAVAAAILAVSEGRRRGGKQASRRWRYRGSA